MKRSSSVGAYLSYLRAKAAKRAACDVSLSYLQALWSRQDGKCALTGLEMTIKLGQRVVPTNASIDRINPQAGYTAGNVQLVCRVANTMKLDSSMAEFVRLCRLVVEKADAEDACLAA
jgi:hypothetical protein